MNQSRLTGVGVAMMLAALSSTASAGLIIFGDVYGPVWSKGAWNLSVDTENTYNGTAASLRRIGGISLAVTDPVGLDISRTPVLRAYVNFLVNETTPGHSLTNVKVRTTDGCLFEFDNRSTGWVYQLDGVEYRDAAEIVFDTDPDTWQLFEIDLGQVDYYGWPYQSQQLGNTPITFIAFSAYGNTTGNITMLADEIRLVPDPAMVILLVLGGLVLLGPQRRLPLGRRPV